MEAYLQQGAQKNMINSTNRRLRVGVVGGGIGGLALAASLRKFGMEAHVFERAPAFGEVGAGIQMTPNAVKIMRELGVWERLREVSFLPQCIVGRNWRSGAEVFRTPLSDECPRLYGAEFFHTHRVDVHSILLSLLPQSSATLSANCTKVSQSSEGATIELADGSAFEADVVVGADGIHSVVRSCLFGLDAPRFTGNMCWRTTIPLDAHPLRFVSPDASFWLGPHGHVVTYYLRAGKMVNVVAIRETKDWVEESWNVPSSAEEMAAAFPGWHPNVLKLFSQATKVFKWGLFDRDPMAIWSSGRITLLGDAAHPMLPFLSQGAAMAIEDGYVLARTLASGMEVAEALKLYQALRLPRTSRVQLESRKRGETYHTATPLRQIYRDFRYKLKQLIEPQSSGLQAGWVYSYDATTTPLAVQL
jgi:salicylate hydroxylase